MQLRVTRFRHTTNIGTVSELSPSINQKIWRNIHGPGMDLVSVSYPSDERFFFSFGF